MRRRDRGQGYPTSQLADGRWIVPGLGVVRCRRPSGTQLALADAQWGPRRFPSDAHDWAWTRIGVDSHDDFCICAPADEPLALWCSRAPRVLKLPGGDAYRLDFVEVKPELRGGPLGVFTMGLVARRALECGAVRLVLGALPQARTAYERLGGKQRAVAGWKVADGLLPYEFLKPDLVQLREAVDELYYQG